MSSSVPPAAANTRFSRSVPAGTGASCSAGDLRHHQRGGSADQHDHAERHTPQHDVQERHHPDRRARRTRVLTGPADSTCLALALHPGGRLLVMGNRRAGLLSGPVTDLDLVSGDAVASLSFSPDGTTVYAAGAHVPLQRYVIDPGQAVAEVRARMGHAELTRVQWRSYVGDMPYQKVCGQ
ncbi:hypothetical protein ACFU3E_23670 [Streptomyces sp. NPDC057424]|uniref:hypothetical protein n=1 Tax=Streptomyces sp. NPDC057424 TaxID=3346127 RepID=UPI0036B24581